MTWAWPRERREVFNRHFSSNEVSLILCKIGLFALLISAEINFNLNWKSANLEEWLKKKMFKKSINLYLLHIVPYI